MAAFSTIKLSGNSFQPELYEIFNNSKNLIDKLHILYIINIYSIYNALIRTGGNNLKIIISNQSELPIYAQIREQIKEQILNGQIKEGEILPSIRSLAKDVGVSVITTTRAYNDLEKEGFIATMQGKGSVVLSSNNKILKEQFIMRIEEGIETAVESAKQIGMTKDEIIAIVDSVWQQD